MPTWWLLALSFIAGSVLPLQAGINGQLSRQVSSVSGAAMISFFIGTLVLLCATLFQREFPSLPALRAMPWWQWVGGFLGALFIFSAALAGPRIGALLFMVLALAGQLAMAALLDHNGWVGFREAPITLSKVAGLVAIFIGVWLIRRG